MNAFDRAADYIAEHGLYRGAAWGPDGPEAGVCMVHAMFRAGSREPEMDHLVRVCYREHRVGPVTYSDERAEGAEDVLLLLKQASYEWDAMHHGRVATVHQ